MNNFPITTERFIAYFDIMGFKDFIYRNSHEEVQELMDKALQTVNDIKNSELERLKKPAKERTEELDKSIVLPVIFSDSIIFVSESNSYEDLKKLLFAASFFLRKAMLNSIPVKGAISYGLFTADFENNLFLGRPLVDAYLLAEETFFYGALLHNTIESYLDEKQEEMPDKIIARKAVPMKGGMITHSYIKFIGDDGFIDKDEENKRITLQKFYLTSSGNVRRYVDNTIEVYITI